LTLADGREWSADITKAPARTLDEGRISTTTVQWAQLKRRGETSLLGVHLFTERRADGVILLSVAVSNAAFDPSATVGFPGGLYYRELRLDVERGTLLPDVVRKGERAETRSLVLASGSHYFPPRAHFNRRFAWIPSPLFGADGWTAKGRAALELRGLTLPGQLANYGPAKLTLPRVNLAAVEITAAQKLAALRGALASGTMPLNAGPFSPLGYAVAGAVGGEGIEFMPGWDATRSGVLLRRLQHDLEMERHPVAWYDARTGDPVQNLPASILYELPRGLNKVTVLPWTVNVPANPWDDSRTIKDWNSGTCLYRDALLEYAAHDGQHLVRATRNGEAAWWLSRDWLSRLDLEMTATDARYAWTIAKMKSIDYPSLGREFGWVANACAIDVAASCGLTNRSFKLDHARVAQELAGRVAMPSGVTQRLVMGWFWGSPDPWLNNGVPFNCDVAQWVLEPPIVGHGLLGLSRAAPCAASARAQWVITQSARSAYLNDQIKTQPSIWNPDVFGIPKWGVVARDGVVLPAIFNAYGPCDPSNSWTHLAEAYEVSRDVAFLEAMNRLGAPVTTKAARIASFGMTELQQTAVALSILQGN
jgi:hypothetical protein